MKSKKWLAMLLAMTMAGTMALSACGGNDGGTSSDDSSMESSQEEQFSAPVITVTPATVEINAGDEIDLLFGVVVTDEYDTGLTATVASDDGFDAETEGTYTITYTATNSKGQTGTATRTIVVSAPLANINVEVAYNLSDPAKVSTILSFPNATYHALSEDTTYDAAYSGIYHNVSNSPIVVDIVGGSGEVAIMDANGVVVEARDGANGRFVNVDNPVRAQGPNSFTYEGQSYPVSANCAKFMQIPAGGIAVVVFQGFAGTGFDYDGRKYVCDNLVGYGYVASVYLNDGKTAAYTTYVNQAPTIKNATPVNVTKGAVTQDEVDAAVKAGLTIKDDNGTFIASDDKTTDWEITIVDRGNLDVNTAGEYTYKLSVTDGTLITQFTRLVKVVADTMTVKIGSAEQAFEKSKVAVNIALTTSTYANYDLVIYTKAYTGSVTEYGYSNAVIVDMTTGKIVRAYDGLNAKYFDANYPTGTKDINSSTSVIVMAWQSLQANEIMLVGANAGSKLARTFLNSNGRNPGADVVISGITLA